MSTTFDQILNEFLSQIEPPLDPVVYRVGFGFIPAVYFFLTDLLFSLQVSFLGTAKGLETIEPLAVRSITDISRISDWWNQIKMLLAPRRTGLMTEFETSTLSNAE
jgi:hypothetical protein